MIKRVISILSLSVLLTVVLSGCTTVRMNYNSPENRKSIRTEETMKVDANEIKFEVNGAPIKVLSSKEDIITSEYDSSAFTVQIKENQDVLDIVVTGIKNTYTTDNPVTISIPDKMYEQMSIKLNDACLWGVSISGDTQISLKGAVLDVTLSDEYSGSMSGSLDGSCLSVISKSSNGYEDYNVAITGDGDSMGIVPDDFDEINDNRCIYRNKKTDAKSEIRIDMVDSITSLE